MSDDKDDVIATWISLGILAFVITGTFKLLKSIGGHEAGQTLNENEVRALARSQTAVVAQTKQQSKEWHTKKVYSYCEIHRENSEQCQSRLYHTHSSNRCMRCNEGLKDTKRRWCGICVQDEYDT